MKIIYSPLITEQVCSDQISLNIIVSLEIPCKVNSLLTRSYNICWLWFQSSIASTYTFKTVPFSHIGVLNWFYLCRVSNAFFLVSRLQPLQEHQAPHNSLTLYPLRETPVSLHQVSTPVFTESALSAEMSGAITSIPSRTWPANLMAGVCSMMTHILTKCMDLSIALS